MKDKKTHILFVCMGNICRSPAAEGVLKEKAKEHKDLDLHIESCGIGDWHLGSSPDERMQEVSRQRGIYLTSKAQQFKSDFFDQFDYILVSDPEVMKHIYEHAKTPAHRSKVALMTHFSKQHKGKEVPDPYYEPDAAFDLVLDILEESCEELISHIKNEQLKNKPHTPTTK